MKLMFDDDVVIVNDIEVIDPNSAKSVNPMLEFTKCALSVFMTAMIYFAGLYMLSSVLDDIFC